MASRAEIDAIVGILEDPTNVDKTTEELAAELIAALGRVDSYRSRMERLERRREEREHVSVAVVAQYSLDGGETLHHAVLGPFATPADGREHGGWGMVGRPSQPGQGRFMLVPAFGNTRDAWGALAPKGAERRLALELARIRRAGGWNPWDPKGPVCRCGVRVVDPRDTGICPVHPERKP